jgi:hypothetical protein
LERTGWQVMRLSGAFDEKQGIFHANPLESLNTVE